MSIGFEINVNILYDELMKINFKTVVISLVGIILLGLFILMTIYLVGRRVNQEYAIDEGPDPTEQFQLSEEYTAITKNYIGEGECVEGECEIIRISLSLTKENEEDGGGEFIYSQVFFGAERDVENVEGKWSEEGENIVLDSDDEEIVTTFLIVDNTLVSEDGKTVLTLLE